MVTAADILAAVVSVLATVVLCLIIFLKKRNRYWAERGVPGPEPQLFFGNFKDAMMVKATESEIIDQITPKFKDKKVIGIYSLWKPIILVKDYEIAKRVMEKDADYFLEHPALLSDELTDYAFYSLFSMEGEVWKTRRQVFSKLFTPKKLKEYIEDMRPPVAALVEELDGEKETLKTMTGFTTLSATKILFGLDLGAGRAEELLHNVERFFHPPIFNLIKVLTFNICPGIFKLFNMGVMPADVWPYAKRLFDEMVDARAGLEGERDDGLTAILKMLNEGGPTFDKIEYKEAVGHTFQFLVASLHTSALALAHTLYRLAQHPEVQEKAREEVDEVLKGAETITYEHLAQMKYLDHVIQETTRLVPVSSLLKRICRRNYELTEDVTVGRGQDVWVDVNSIHRDPKLFPEPLKFMPERWASPELSDASAFYSFGRGPRMCLGKRLAEVQTKFVLSTLLSKFEVLPSEKNQDPLRYDPKTVLLSAMPLGGIWINFKPRS